MLFPPAEENSPLYIAQVSQPVETKKSQKGLPAKLQGVYKRRERESCALKHILGKNALTAGVPSFT